MLLARVPACSTASRPPCMASTGCILSDSADVLQCIALDYCQRWAPPRSVICTQNTMLSVPGWIPSVRGSSVRALRATSKAFQTAVDRAIEALAHKHDATPRAMAGLLLHDKCMGDKCHATVDTFQDRYAVDYLRQYAVHSTALCYDMTLAMRRVPYDKPLCKACTMKLNQKLRKRRRQQKPE